MVPRKQKKSHDPKLIAQAIKEVKNRKGNLREIAQKYGIPKSTLHFKVKYPDHRTSFGPPPVLTADEEEALENWIILLAQTGFPIKKGDLQSSVQKLLKENPRVNNFKDNNPGAGWLRGFFKRHPSTAGLFNESGTQPSADFSESNIRRWFSEIHDYLDKSNLLEVLNDSSRIFNGEETCFTLCPDTGKILVARDFKNLNKFDCNYRTESVSVLYTFSADGQACPPLVVYDYERIPQKVTKAVPDGWAIARCENGLIDSEIFLNYISDVFHPYLMQKNVTMPVIYFVDPFKTHLTYEVSTLCKTLNIEIIGLYPDVASVLLPGDVAALKPLKAAWKIASRKWLIKNGNDNITRINFAEALNVGLKDVVVSESLSNSFRVCGLFPFNPNNIDYSQYLAKDKRWSQEINKSEPSQPKNVITMSKFTDILGTKKIIELETCKNVTEQDENFQLLYKLYDMLKGSNFHTHNSKQEPTFNFVECRSDIEDADFYVKEEYLDDTVDSNESTISSDLQQSTDYSQKFLNIPTNKIENKTNRYRKVNATLRTTPYLKRNNKPIETVKDRKNKPFANNIAITNSCSICTKATNTSNRVNCCVCSLSFHVNCVPKEHQKSLSGESLFLCHKCIEDSIALGDNVLDDEDEKIIIII